MSRVAARFHNQIVTMLTITKDEYGDIVTVSPVIEVKCEFKTGDKAVRDDKGTEFVPDYVIYTTDSRASGYKNGYIYMKPSGDVTELDSPKIIRAVRYLPALRGMGGGDYVLYV